MSFDLVQARQMAQGYGWAASDQEDGLHVSIPGVGTLILANDADDTYLGFVGSVWHTHGDLMAAM